MGNPCRALRLCFPVYVWFVTSALVFSASAPAESRDWTDAAGKHHTSATLLECHGGVAYLEKDDGKILAVPLARLSRGDQQFAKDASPEVKVIQGKVIGVTDGDTLTVLDGRTPRKIRLEGIDAPESHQAYGNKAKEALAGMVFQKVVRVEWRQTDRYGRTLGDVIADGKWVNKDMVEQGWAWHYREYSNSPVLTASESDARTNVSGLWQGADPTPPWEFRHPKSSAVVQSNGGVVPAQAQQVLPQTLLAPATDGQVPNSQSAAQATKPDTSSAGTVDRNPRNETVTGQTATGIPTFTGPRGGHYHYSPSGRKVYERRKR